MINKVVLLVEDNEDDVELTVRSFEKLHLTSKLVIARNGQEALDYLFAKGEHVKRNLHDLPILVLLDLKLPKVDGLEVLHQIRSRSQTRRIPVVILTSSSQPKDKWASYDSGANSYIQKPVDFDRFTEVTRHLGTYWLEVNDPPPMTL